MCHTSPLIETVGIIGYGRFGKLLAGVLADSFTVLPYDTGFSTGYTLEEAASADALFLCVPIVALESAIKQVAPFVGPETHVLDVCSVKVYPESLLTRYFRSENTLPTHPMFGPDAAKEGVEGLPIALCPTEGTKQELVDYWESIFRKHGLRVDILTCDAHDKNTAYSLCLTQFLGRALDELDLGPSTIDTQNYRHLLTIRDMALNDSPQLFEGLQTFNPYAGKMRMALIDALVKTDNKLGRARPVAATPK